MTRCDTGYVLHATHDAPTTTQILAGEAGACASERLAVTPAPVYFAKFDRQGLRIESFDEHPDLAGQLPADRRVCPGFLRLPDVFKRAVDATRRTSRASG